MNSTTALGLSLGSRSTSTCFLNKVPGCTGLFSNKVSALPQFMPFKNVHEERSKKIAFDPLTSSGFMAISTADAFDTLNKSFTGVVQKNLVLDKQGGTRCTMAAYPLQHGDTHSAHHSHDIRAFSASNHMISVAMSNPFFKTHSPTSTHNFGTASMKLPPPLGGIPIMANPTHSFVPNGGSMVGSADQRNISKQAGVPAQFTIFYGGLVNVYDDVSPEKAQTIMFLAGNGSSVNPSQNPRALVVAPTPKPVVGDGVHGNQSHSKSSRSGLSSPMSVAPHVAAQSGCGSGGTDEVMVAKTMGALIAPISLPEPPKSFTTLGSAATTLMPAAMPQVRNASLARFLEKRRERVMSTVPCNTSKKSLDGSTTPGSHGVSFSGNNGVKEQS